MPTIVRQTGFEGGGAVSSFFDSIASGAGTLAIDTANSHSGSQCLKVVTVAGVSEYGQWNDPSGHFVAVFSGYFFLDSLPAAGTKQNLFSIQYTSQTEQWQLLVDETGLISAKNVAFSGTTTTTGPTVAAGSQHLFDVLVDCSGSVQTSRWRIDGVARTNPPDNNDFGPNAIDDLLIGSNGAYADSGGAMTFRWDDCALSLTAADYPLGGSSVVVANAFQ